MRSQLTLLFAGLVAVVFTLHGRSDSAFTGQWRLDPERSSPVDPWRSIELDLFVEGDQGRIEERLTTGRRSTDQAFEVDLSGGESDVPLDWWSGNRHIGAFAESDAVMRIRGERADGGQTLRLESYYTLHTSQSETPVREYVEYRISGDGQTLTRMTLRSTRPLPVLHVFERR